MKGKSWRLGLLLLAAAFLVAVQRDTFVRRWMLPAKTVAETSLDAVLPVVDIRDQHYTGAIEALSRLAGVPIDVDPTLLALRKAGSTGDFLLNIKLHDVTLRQALEAVDASTRSTSLDDETVAVCRNGRISLVWRKDYSVARSYPIGHVIRSDLISSSGPDSKRELTAAVKQMADRELPFMANSDASIMIIGDTMFVIGTDADQRRISHSLEILNEIGQKRLGDLH